MTVSKHDDIFLSYSRKDSEKAEALKHHIESFGYSVWMDIEDIRGGDLWRAQIVEGIENCQLYIVILTKNSIQSDNVRREIDLARAKTKPILPVYAEPTPTQVGRDMEYQLVGLQVLCFEELFDKQAEKTLTMLIGAPATRLMPAISMPAAAFLETDEGHAIPLIRETVTIGRGPGVDVDLSSFDRNRFVSKRHGELRSSDGVWKLHAYQGTSNPTSINGKMVPKGSEVQLSDKDQIDFADVTVKFVQRQR